MEDLGPPVQCSDAQVSFQDNEWFFQRMQTMRNRSDQALAAHNRGQLSEGQLKRVLLDFADTQEAYTNSFRRMISLMREDDESSGTAVDRSNVPFQPMLALPEYCGPPPPYSETPNEDVDMGVNIRHDSGLRRRGGSNQPGDGANANQGGRGHGLGGQGHGGGGDPNDPWRPQGQGHMPEGGGCCPECLRSLLDGCRRFFSAFVDLVGRFLRAVWSFVCWVGGKIRDLARWIAGALELNETQLHGQAMPLLRGQHMVAI